LDLRKLAQENNGRQIGAGEFRTMVEQLLEKQALSGGAKAEAAAAGEKSAGSVDAGEYLLAKDQLSNSLAPALFQSLDQDGNGVLEGQELGKLDDVLTHLNRERLFGDDASQLGDLLGDLTEIIAET
jgi:hypothetical protein